jgi:imidazoleglycerol-phosphate dehydratase
MGNHGRPFVFTQLSVICAVTLGGGGPRAYNARNPTAGAIMRSATITRKTAETDITVTLNLDGAGVYDNRTGIGFFDHMLDQLSRHALIDMTVAATGDLHIDDHHTVEDVGIALGQALAQAVGDKRGITRYGSCLLPMDDALVRTALDLSGRPFLVWNVDLPTAKIGTFDTELVREFFQAFATHGGITLHVDALHGINSHHIAEAAFKSVARALRDALAVDPRTSDAVPSTKGLL